MPCHGVCGRGICLTFLIHTPHRRDRKYTVGAEWRQGRRSCSRECIWGGTLRDVTGCWGGVMSYLFPSSVFWIHPIMHSYRCTCRETVQASKDVLTINPEWFTLPMMPHWISCSRQSGESGFSCPLISWMFSSLFLKLVLSCIPPKPF